MAAYLPASARAVLDVGCSSGEFGRGLRACRDVRLHGLEPNPVAAEAARAVYDEVATGCFPEDANRLPDLRYDAIYFNDVLEHMPDPRRALDAAAAMLTGSGVVIASIPNVRHISVTGPLVVLGEFRYRETGILDRTHLRFFTRRSITRMFAEAGWQVERLDAINRVLRVGRTRTPWWIAALGRVSRGWTDGLFAVQYVAVARPPVRR